MTTAVSEDFPARLLDSALSIARSFAVFPVHGPAGQRYKGDAEFPCSCNKASSCENKAKHPIARLAPHGLNSASTDELTIRRWWRSEPRANIGVAVPSGFVVLDIDGPEGLAALMSEEFVLPQKTPHVSTGRGWHYWFRTTQDVRPGADFMDHVDMRGPGGYVIAPPSMHKTGRLYEWEEDLTAEVATAPDWIYELASRPSRGRAGALEKSGLDMQSILHGVDEGQRDVQLFRAASKLRYADVDYEMALDIILDAAAKCSPPFPADQAKVKVESAYGRYQPSIQLDSGHGEVTLLSRDAIRVLLNGPSGPVEFTFREMQKTSFDSLESELTVQLLQPGTSLDSYQSRLNMLSHNNREGIRRELQHVIGVENKTLTVLFNRAIQEARERFLNQPRAVKVTDIPAPDRVEYIVDQLLLDSERPTILFGPGGSLKTFVMMSLTLCIAAGRDWLGRKVQKRNCMLVDYETGRGMSGMRLRMLARGMGLEDGLQNIYWWDPDGVPFYDLAEALKRDVQALNIGFLGLDHCAAACGTEPERAESATRTYRAMSRIKVPSVFLAHVTGNIADNPESARRPFGSVFWENGAALTWFVQKEEQAEDSPLATVGLFQRKWNDTGRLRDFSLSMVFEQDRIKIEPVDLRDSPTLMTTRGVKEMLYEALLQPHTVEELKEMTNQGEATIRRTLNRNPKMFENVTGVMGGKPNTWQRLGHRDALNKETIVPDGVAASGPTRIQDWDADGTVRDSVPDDDEDEWNGEGDLPFDDGQDR